MRIVLIGPPAAGKSRVGKRLARRLDLPYIDTDAVIVAEHGPIAGIFAERGEPHFRELERTAVAESLRADAVISLGGGAVLHPDTRRELAGSRVVLLMVQAEAVAERIANGKRPLVHDIQSWQRLVDSRAELYASLAGYSTDVTGRPISTIVDEIALWAESQSGHMQSQS